MKYFFKYPEGFKSTDCCLKAGHQLFNNSENVTFSSGLKQLAAFEILPCDHVLCFYL